VSFLFLAEGNDNEETGSVVKEQEDFKENQRLRVAKELVETERKYCHTLHTIQHTFAQPLKGSGILTMRDIKYELFFHLFLSDSDCENAWMSLGRESTTVLHSTDYRIQNT
jgi:hypothetical protein